MYYEDERRKAKHRELSGISNPDPNLEQGRVNEILAAKAGVGKSNIAYLLAVKRSRPDLYEQVFIGKYSINKAYTTMKLDENPPTTEEERQEELNERSTQLSVRQHLQ